MAACYQILPLGLAGYGRQSDHRAVGFTPLINWKLLLFLNVDLSQGVLMEHQGQLRLFDRVLELQDRLRNLKRSFSMMVVTWEYRDLRNGYLSNTEV